MKLILLFLVGNILAESEISELSTGNYRFSNIQKKVMQPFCKLHFYSFEEDGRLTWFAAKDHCEKEGGKLVEIDSEEENTALVDEINRRGYDNNRK